MEYGMEPIFDSLHNAKGDVKLFFLFWWVYDLCGSESFSTLVLAMMGKCRAYSNRILIVEE